MVVAASLLGATAITLADPFLNYTGYALQMFVMSLIAVVMLLVGVVLGIVGVRRQNLKCVLVLFFTLLFAVFWIGGLAIFT